MQKSTLVSTLLALGISSSALAQTIHIQYNGTPVKTEVHLEKNDVVMIDTTVKVGRHFFVVGNSKNQSAEEIANFHFNSSVVGVEPEREGEFVDSIFAGANPGWVSYTFTGEKAIDAVFTIYNW